MYIHIDNIHTLSAKSLNFPLKKTILVAQQ